ncbi:Ig-like domain-containing protein [Melissococcus plutonius]|uniref:Ig-like domain-containing protein n=1 Tax=Melissococcus plutonius TaxID=33970 RepID=UPI0021E5DE5F|nr:Ig-like domain-containing protein [Melissococcus plutonius]MCV2499568.1 Ig-like domain-containing protein [Melissococcus plutonius]MCV2501858.1 Ig-like domain-containing protein [Melissococcus plutonius]MCV2505938.1 Ig-like domain-containing protein [Melissococcus plutonius]MCV2508180.1 Ig-like domain-containing protein [Melissococcus plutonius]MCV2528044.1 Ig-like domain-containing protein [Melissococcus plutonius]
MGGITGNSKDGYIITGNTNPGNTIIVKTSQGKIVGTIATDDKGNYAVTILAGKVNPEDVLQIVGKDIAGNESLAANIKTPADPKAPIQ